MGSQPSMPQAPAAPTASASMADYVASYPQLAELQKQYAPQFAALDYGIQQQYQPQQLALGEQLAGQASEGMTQAAPDWYKQNVRDSLMSNFGRNAVYNPQGQEQFGLATSQANEDWRRYYQNMGMSISNKVPLTQNTMQTAQAYNPATVMNMASNTFGTQAGMYGTQMQNYMQGGPSNPWANIAGSLAGGIGSGIGTGMGYGMMGGFKKP